MSTRDIREAKNPDLRASVVAMQRVAELARQTAIQTGTYLVVVEDGKVVRIPASVLRAAAADQATDLPVDADVSK